MPNNDRSLLRLRSAGVTVACLLCFFASSFAQIADPIPEAIVKSGLAVAIEDVVALPATSGSAPLARINALENSGDGSGRLFVNDLRGPLHVIEGSAVQTYFDLSVEFPDFVDDMGFGTGFSSLAFHPDFRNNGIFYTAHSEGEDAATPDLRGPVASNDVRYQGVIVEWTASDPTANAFAGSRREILRIELPGYIHNIGQMGFDPAGGPNFGLLFIPVGDGGSLAFDVPEGTHRLDSPLGTILRIDPAGTNGRNGQYGIPGGNPWASDGDPLTLDEIWAYGFRNPLRMSWDTGGDGKMLIADIGEGNIEEINLGISGADYGWPDREGSFLFDPATRNDVFALPQDDASLGFTYPVAQYDHDEGFAIVGGYVYRGCDIPELVGKYVFGDNVNGRLFYTDVDDLVQGSQADIHELTLTRTDGTEASLLEIMNDTRADLRFGLDESGELHVITKRDGLVRRLVSLGDDCEPDPDADGDGVSDADDNCPDDSNSDQTDGDADGLGDACEPFSRGDANEDLFFDLSDAIVTLIHVFLGGIELACEKSADSNDDGSINVADSNYSLNFIFARGPIPAEPFGECGKDPTADGLDCASYPGCDSGEAE